LVTNHVRLILQPGEAISGLGPLKKRLSGRQSRFVNRQESRTGTLWEGRYRFSPIATDAYVLACGRYVELNPVRARMNDDPAGEWELIREALQRGQLTGTERFCDEIEVIIGQRIENRKQGRPRKNTRK
jgi:putative transposase